MMAMTKAERERMEQLEKAVALARSMRWPEYGSPAPMTVEEKRANFVDGGMKYGTPQKVAFGYFQNSHSIRVTRGCSDGYHHNIEGDATSSQGGGVMYANEADAWKAMRVELTLRFAEVLARVDEKIQRLTP